MSKKDLRPKRDVNVPVLAQGYVKVEGTRKRITNIGKQSHYANTGTLWGWVGNERRAKREGIA